MVLKLLNSPVNIILHFLLDGNTLDEDDISDAESVHDYDKNSTNSSGLCGDKIPIEILEPIKSLGLVEKLWQIAQPIAENVTEMLREATEKKLLDKCVNDL